MLSIFGYFSAILMGISLGMIGAGGSILVVPILVYLFKVPVEIATTNSLFIVGNVAAVGTIQAWKKRQLQILSTLWFAVPSFLGVYLTRSFLLPNLPETLFQYSHWTLTKSELLMGLFALLMVGAAISMYKSPKVETQKHLQLGSRTFIVALTGFIVGSLTSLIGAGGGFLMIPALVVLLGLPMSQAAGTSLFLIFCNSYFGYLLSFFTGNQFKEILFNITLSAIAIVGLFVGRKLATKVSDQWLRKGFAVFILIMGSFILLDQFL